MLGTELSVFVNVLATQTSDQAAPGFDFMTLLLPVALGLFLFMMFRKQKKVQSQLQQQRSQMVPGTEVMTQFGLYGTVLSVDQEENKAVLEISPGNTATVHLQALTKIVSSPEAPVVPDDASSLTAEEDKPRSAPETPDETIARPHDENKNKDN
jgi:preprotein translocase subunit YajC